MCETGLQCLISLCLALIVVCVGLPYLNRSLNLNLSFWQQDNTAFLLTQIGLTLLLVTVLSGLYPALFLSRFNPVRVLKGDFSTGSKAKLLRNGLIVLQFMVSAFFIIATLGISAQTRYMQNKEKGFSDEQVMRIESTQKNRDKDFDAVRNRLLAIPGVVNVAKTTRVPGDRNLDTSTVNFKFEGKEHPMASVKISTDYFKTLQVEIIKGRSFTESFADQNTRTAIINESAEKKLNAGNLVGKTLSFPYCDSVPLQIVGVVKDFNVHGFETAVQPVVYTIGNKACMFQSGGAILVKLNTNHTQQSVAAIQSAWKSIEPDFPIRYSFLDENFQQLFVSHMQLQKIITFFAVIAILVSVMGLFALTTFFAKRQTKEIGIRKVLGATVANLALLVSKEFIYLVVLSVIIVTPVAWWMLNKWLQTFVYRTEINWMMFAIAASTVLCIAILTVSFQAIKAAVANPVKSLRTE
jgi:putative ABC transport system permease protein